MMYRCILARFREANPDIPYKQAQQEASRIYREYKRTGESAFGCGEVPSAAASNPKIQTEPIGETKTGSRINWDKVSRVEGPVRMEEWVGLGKHVYLFGEEHEWRPTCPYEHHGVRQPIVHKSTDTLNNRLRNARKPNVRAAYGSGPPVKPAHPTIAQLLEYMIRSNPDKIIDFFLEVRFLRPGHEQVEWSEPTPGISELLSFFRRCFRRSKKECEFPNLRAHYIDIRKVSSVSYDAEIELNHLYYWLINHLSPQLAKTHTLSIDIPRHVYENMKRLWNALSFENLYTPDIVIPRVEKQFKNIEKSFPPGKGTKKRVSGAQVKKVIREEVPIEFPDRKDLYKAFSTLSEVVASGIPKITPQKARLLLPFAPLSVAVAHMMDIYLLSRMFRSFARPQHGRPSAPSPRYVVIFAGDWHIEEYRRVFAKLGFSRVASSISHTLGKDYQCIDIRPFRRPFFSK